jgi:hypothetical protein
MTPSFEFYLGAGDISTVNHKMQKLIYKSGHKIIKTTISWLLDGLDFNNKFQFPAKSF